MNKLIKHILDNNLVVNCKTEEDAKELLKLAHESGLKWCTGSAYDTEKTKHEVYGLETCYCLKEGNYGYFDVYTVWNMKIIDLQKLKKQLGITETPNKETVLEVEFVDVFDGYKAWRITKQDEEILERGKFEDREIGVYSGCRPCMYKDNDFYIRGIEKHSDNDVNVCTNKQAEIIKEKVRLINEKYGRPKFDAEEEYKKLKEVEFVYGKESYSVDVDKTGKYTPQIWIGFCKMVGLKYVSKEDAEEFCRRVNGEK